MHAVSKRSCHNLNMIDLIHYLFFLEVWLGLNTFLQKGEHVGRLVIVRLISSPRPSHWTAPQPSCHRSCQDCSWTEKDACLLFGQSTYKLLRSGTSGLYMEDASIRIKLLPSFWYAFGVPALCSYQKLCCAIHYVSPSKYIFH